MSGLDVAIVRLADNVGPAGGWAAGLGIFSDGRADFAWLFDDDCAARPDALERALAYAAERDAHVVQSTMLDSSSGADVSTQGWCGVLVHRAVVEAVGVPDESLVWWTEDTEYLHWRIPRAGWTVARSADSIVELPIRPTGGPKPSWKYYYEARNQVAYRLRTQRPGPSDRPIPRYLSRRVRYWRAGRSVAKLIGRALLVEDANRLTKLRMVIRGSWGGLRGQKGLVVPLGTPDRARHALDRGAP